MAQLKFHLLSEVSSLESSHNDSPLPCNPSCIWSHDSLSPKTGFQCPMPVMFRPWTGCPRTCIWPIVCVGSDTAWHPRLGLEKSGSFFLNLWKLSGSTCSGNNKYHVRCLRLLLMRKCKWPCGDAMWRETEAWVAPTSASYPDRGTTPGKRSILNV